METGYQFRDAVHDIVTNSLPPFSGLERLPRRDSWESLLAMTNGSWVVQTTSTNILKEYGLPRAAPSQ